jgi:hypothetical protein
MDLSNHSGKFSVPADIPRCLSALDPARGRAVTNKRQVRTSATFSQVAAAAMNGSAWTPANPAHTPAAKNIKSFGLWEKGPGFGFGDFIDIINPLQHIPIVATVYRNYTGDQIGAASRIIGGGLWGRIGGFISGLANAVVEWWSGKDIGDHIYAALFGAANDAPDTSALSQNKLPMPAPAAGASVPAHANGGDAASVICAANPAHGSGAADANTLGSEALPLAHAARTSYERSRKWGEPDESLGVCFPA